MVLVHHDLEAHLLGDLPLVDEAMVEVGADLRVVVAVGELDPDGVVLFRVGQQVIRVLAEEPATHAAPPPTCRGRGRSPECARQQPRAARGGESVRRARRARDGILEWPRDRDRKSTRLNSSHGYISYAVFCLKKKKEHV